MKYRLFSVVLALVLVTLFMAVPRAQAHPRVQTRPFADMLCDGSSGQEGCHAFAYWYGSSVNHGNGSTFTVDNPGGSGFQFYRKGVYESNPNGYQIFLGVGKSDGVCSGLSFEFSISLNGALLTSNCKGVLNGDINQLVDAELSYFVSNGGGIFYNLTGKQSGNIWHLIAVSCPGCTQSFNYVENQFRIHYSSFTGHAVWGGQWINNEYFDGQWNYDASWFYPTIVNDMGIGPPPQARWVSYPNGAQNTGGDLWTCLYDSTYPSTQCNLGS